MNFETLSLSIIDGVATVTLDRPDRLNAVSIQMCDELRSVVLRIQRDAGVRALLLTGSGRGFCSGADQSPENVPPPDDPDLLVRDYFNPVYSMIADLRIPKVAAVNGVAAGAGMSLALTFDIVLAARSAYFLPAFINQALVPDSGASWQITRAVGAARAIGFLTLNRKLPAQQAADWGLIWECVEDDALMERAKGLAHELAAGPTVALAQTVRLTRSAGTNSLTEQLHAEMDAQRIARATQDREEARRAFAEKRKPVFSGR